MLKRFYSKRSGFTLVEIIVAFAVFSIMASMVAQILQLAISARNSNNLYARELARQERLLTIIDKDSKYYNETDKTGQYALTIDGKKYELGYQVKATDPTAINQAEGINYFLSPVDYQSSGAGTGTPGSGTPSSSGGTGGMSQASRMDTRITGTAGIGDITIHQVIKDEFAYPDDSPFKIPEGHTRYWIEVSASSKNADGDLTLRKEDVPYSQFRLLFFSDQKDAAESAKVIKPADGSKQYTQDVYQRAEIVKVGHIKAPMDGLALSVQQKGLSDSNTSSGDVTDSYNKFLVQKLASNSVRIGTPFVGTGTRFSGQYTRFYVEFVGDPHLTVKSFGANGVETDDGSVIYRACPMYPEKYKDDGTPEYEAPLDGSVHPSIYGGYLYTRHYVTGTPEAPKDDTE